MTDDVFSCPVCKVDCEPCGDGDDYWCPVCRGVYDGDTGEMKFIEPKNGKVVG